MAYEDTAARFTVSGSFLSCLATCAVLLYCLACRDGHRSIRHALILNLVLAGKPPSFTLLHVFGSQVPIEFLNAFNNSISGFIYVDTRRLSPGPACRANAFFAQLTSQTVDFTVLAVVLITFATITRVLHLPDLNVRWKKLLICSSTWLLPLILSIAGASMDVLSPVGGNWCAISTTRLELRYALVEGWRVAVVFLTIASYACISCLLHYRSWMRCFFGEAERKRLSRTKSVGSQSTVSNCLPADSPLQGNTSVYPAKRCEGSELSLPIQGSWNLDGRTERASRWNYVRYPGTLNSLHNFTSRPRSLVPNQTPGPHYHSQCPKVTKSVDVAGDDEVTPTLASSGTLPRDVEKSGPRYSQWPNIKRAFSISSKYAQESAKVPSRTNSDKILDSNHQPPQIKRTLDQPPGRFTEHLEPSSGPRYHNQCHKVQRSFEVSLTASDEQPEPSPEAHCHSQRPKLTLPVETTRSSPSETMNPLSMPRYEVHCPKTKRFFEVSAEQVQRLNAKSGPNYHGQSPRVTPSVEGSGTPSGPNYHSQCPKITQSVEVVSSSTRPGPNYHRQCPKVTQPVDVSSVQSGPNYHSQSPKVTQSVDIVSSTDIRDSYDKLSPKMPRRVSLAPPVSPMAVLSPTYTTKTTISTSPYEPPPSPTLGLPPPPWVEEQTGARRKTFLLSKSTWSESTMSKNGRHRDRASKDDMSRAAEAESEIRKTLLLNAYPLAYVVLWMPAVVGYFLQARGSAHGDTPAMNVLVGLSQYLGLANAITFAVHEVIRRKVRLESRALVLTGCPWREKRRSEYSKV